MKEKISESLKKQADKVFSKTNKTCKEIINEVNKYYEILDDVNWYIYKKTYGYDGPDTLLIWHADPEIRASIFLALNGHYYQAISLFRIIMDTSFRLLYFEDDIMAEIAWSEHPEKFNPRIDFVSEFFRWDFANYYDHHTNFEKEIRKNKKKLNLYIHPGGEGMRHIPPNIFGTGIFSEELLKKWLEYYKTTIKFLCISSLLMMYSTSIESKTFKKYLEKFTKQFPEEWELILKSIKFHDYHTEVVNNLFTTNKKEIEIDIKASIKKFDEKNDSLKKFI